MSVHQTSDGRYFVAYREKGARQVRRKYFGRGPEGKLAAKRWETDWLAARSINPAAVGGHPDLTFDELAQLYLHQHPLAEASRRAIYYALKLYVHKLFGSKRVVSLDMTHLTELDGAIAAAGRSLATRNRYRSYCKAICQWGVDNDLLVSNPFLKFSPETKKEGRAPDLLKDNELTAIYGQAPEHLKWAIEVMINTGVRPGRSELFALLISDVDFERGGIWLRREKTRERHKTLLPLRREFLEKIARMKAENPGREYLIEYEGRAVVSLRTAWRNTLRRAGISRKLRMYDLRHWYASKLISGGADIKVASELLGHASPTTTLTTYYHLVDSQKRETVDSLKIPDLPSS